MAKNKTVKKILKITAITIGVILLILIVTPFLFKGKILKLAQSEANKSLNATVKFEDLNLSMFRSFPDLSVELVELSVVGKDTFKLDTLAAFSSFQAGVNVMSLISGDEIKVNKIILNGAKIHAIVLQDSTANWDIMKASGSEETAKEDSTKKEDNGEPTKFKVKLKKLEVNNLNLIFDDRSSAVYAKVKNFNFKLKGDMSQDLTNLAIQMGIEELSAEAGGIKYLKKAKVNFKSTIEANMKNSVYTLKDNEFSLNKIVLGFAGTVAMPDTNIVTDITFNTTETEFKSVLSLIPAVYAKDFETIQTSGKFEFDGFVKGTYNAVNLPAVGINFAVNGGRLQYPDLPKSVENINIAVAIAVKEGNADYIDVDLKRFHMEMAGNPIDAAMQINMTPADVNMAGNIKGKVELASMADIVPLEDTKMKGTIALDLDLGGKLSDIEQEEYGRFKADGTMTVTGFNMGMEGMPPININSASMAFSPQFVDLKNLDMKIGKSDMALFGRIDNLYSYIFKDELLKGTFNFSSQLLDLNELMGDESTTQTTEENVGSTQTSESSGAIEVPSNIDFVLNTSIAKMLYDKLDITNASGSVVVRNSRVNLSNFIMHLLDGSMAMNGFYDSKNKAKPMADFQMDINGFQISKTYDAFTIIQETAPIAKNCSGKVSMGMQLTTILDAEMAPIMSTVNSRGNFISDNIKINNNGILNQLGSKIKMNKYSKPTLNNLNVNFKIKNGNIIIEPTEFQFAGSKASFSGTQNLDKTILYNLSLSVPAGAAKNVLSKLDLASGNENISVTAVIGGTVDKPRLKEFKSGLVDDVKDAVKEVVEEVKDQAKKKAAQILAAARKKADQVIATAEKAGKKGREQAKIAGDKLIREADNQGKRLIKKANNTFARKAAKIAAKKLVEQAKKQSRNLQSKAKKKSDELTRAAKNKADQIIKKAEREAANA